ncbi:STIV orfB116 family protein [Selenomonas montiformis]|uniref:STIV orfB116 family protein n=1 Tax=Selenomonas montiformis TaxID=2652285 RepID=UPI003F89C892
MITLFNAISIQMVPVDSDVFTWQGQKISTEQAAQFARDGVVSFIGHEDTARVLSGILGVDVPFRRAFGTLTPGEPVLVAQVTGGRLPEGATTLPEGVSLQFWLVTAS